MKQSAHLPIFLFLATVAVAASLMLGGCDQNPTDGSEPTIVTGSNVEVATRSLPSSGGIITIATVGSPINGMEIDVPAGAYSDARTFHISQAPITGHEFGPDFNPLTPLITIENGGGYSDDPITVTIPVKVPAGHFAMPFMYDQGTGRLEALPLVYADSTQVSFITRNFQHSTTAAFGKGTAGGPRSSILISSTDAATLDGTFDSGFEMGIDNCQFVNWGSYVEPDGHCGGQSIATMWYYSTRKKNGSPGLYGLFDNDGVERTPAIWYDDVHLYRFCSIVQTRQNWNSLNIKYFEDKSWERDLATYRSIAFAIRETGDPQCIYLSDDGPVGHAIIAYRTSNGKIMVCDPNYPEQEKREIVFDRRLGDFEPYNSGSTAGSVGTKYFNIHCAANSALIDWNELEELWKKVLNGTIGDDVFPAVRIKVRDMNNDYVPLTDGMKVPTHMTIDVSADAFEPQFRVFDFATQGIITDNDRDFKLPPGKQRIGIYYKGPGDFWNSNYIGFKWFNVDVQQETEEQCPVTVILDNVPVTNIRSAEWLYYSLTGTLQASIFWPNPKSPTSNGVNVITRREDSPGGVFPGKGTYTLDNQTIVLLEDEGYSCDAGTLTITRYDLRIEGEFNLTATSRSGIPKTISVRGTLSCDKQ